MSECLARRATERSSPFLCENRAQSSQSEWFYSSIHDVAGREIVLFSSQSNNDSASICWLVGPLAEHQQQPHRFFIHRSVVVSRGRLTLIPRLVVAFKVHSISVFIIIYTEHTKHTPTTRALLKAITICASSRVRPNLVL